MNQSIDPECDATYVWSCRYCGWRQTDDTTVPKFVDMGCGCCSDFVCPVCGLLVDGGPAEGTVKPAGFDHNDFAAGSLLAQAPRYIFGTTVVLTLLYACIAVLAHP